MKAVFAVVALLAAVQLASANDYAPKKYAFYTPAPKVTYVPEVVIKEKKVTEVCLVEKVVLTAPAVPACDAPYTPDAKTGKCVYIKKVCEDPKPKYEHPVYVTKGYGRKLQDAYKPKFKYVAHKVQYVPKVSHPVCKDVTVYADPTYKCSTGTYSKGVCIIGYKQGDCPKDFVRDSKDNSLCVLVTVVQEKVIVQKPVVVQKPKYDYVHKPTAVYGRRLMDEDEGEDDGKHGDKVKTIISTIGHIAGKFLDKVHKDEDHKPDYHKPEYKHYKPEYKHYKPDYKPKPEYKHEPKYPLCTVKYADKY